MMKSNYFTADIKRLIKRPNVYVAIVGVTISLFFSLEGKGIVNDNILSTYITSTELSGIMVAYIFCAFSYALSLCESLEQKYMRYEVVRGNLKKYLISKVSVTYVSSVLTMVMGTVVFLLMLRMRIPWVDFKSDSQEIIIAGQFAVLFQEGHYFIYCIIYAMHLGMLAGTLSVFALLVSMYITNKVTILAVPLLAYQILLDNAGDSIFTVFSYRIYNRLFGSDFHYVIFILAFSIIPVLICTYGMYRKIKQSI